MIFQLVFSIIILAILLSYSEFFGKYLKIIDNPDNNRKLHKKPTSLFGGIAILLTLILFNLISYKYNIFLYNSVDIIFLTIFVLIGFIDDRDGLTPTKKLLYLSLVFLFYFYVNKKINIQTLNFTSFQYEVDLGFFSGTFFSFCFLLLINALNMTDGKNGLCASIQILILTILIYYGFDEINNLFEIAYIFFLITFLIFNFRGKVFLGDSGVYLGTFIITNKIFLCYENIINFKIEQIFILLLIPGIDMLRVFIVRLKKNKPPFQGDRNHFHHLLERKLNTKGILLIYLNLILIPNFFVIKYPEHTLINVIITVLIYSLIIYIFRKKQNESNSPK